MWPSDSIQDAVSKLYIKDVASLDVSGYSSKDNDLKRTTFTIDDHLL